VVGARAVESLGRADHFQLPEEEGGLRCPVVPSRFALAGRLAPTEENRGHPQSPGLAVANAASLAGACREAEAGPSVCAYNFKIQAG